MGDLTKKDDPLTDCYEVTLQAVCVVFVRGAKNANQAMEFAQNEISGSSYEMVDGNTVRLRASEVDSSRRHANERSEP